MPKTLVIDFLVFKPQFSRRFSRVFFSASSRLSRNFRGRLAGLAQIAVAGRISRRLRGLLIVEKFIKESMIERMNQSVKQPTYRPECSQKMELATTWGERQTLHYTKH